MKATAAGSDELAPDTEAISRFLRETVGDAIHLAWIVPDGPCGGRWFGDDTDKAAAWAASNNASGRNVYWTVNVVSAGLNKKPEKTDITHARFVHVDIDPPKDGGPFDRQAILEQLTRLEPGLVLDSGGGLQAFWRLLGECEDLCTIEAVNLQVRGLFNADACQNIDRLMRVPGTVNWPNARKRARGRVPATASVLVADTGEAIEADRLRERFRAALSARCVGSGQRSSLLEVLGITTFCQPLYRLLTATNPNRRSEEVLHAAGEMIRRKLEDETIIRVLIDPALAISGHCLDQADPRRAAERAIASARKRDRHEFSEGENGHGVQLADFHAYMPAHSYIFAPTAEHWPATSVNSRVPPLPLVDESGHPLLDKDGKVSLVKASAWLDQNRAVEQMTWAPGEPQIVQNRLISDGGWIKRPDCSVFNLYRPPLELPGDAAKAGPWLDHVVRVYPDASEHIVKWLAHRVQRPHEKINHALVLGGPQGIGKDTILEPVKGAIGPWNFAEVSPQHMLGRFNGFIKSVVLRVSEARDLGDIDRFAFYDHMKTYTAAPPDVLRIDEKYVREYAVFNVCGVIITTNHKADGIYLPVDDRRHYVAWSDCTRDSFSPDYWTKLYGWYEDGGIGHVAAHLRGLDITGIDAKAPPPKTAAFWDIVASNQAPEEAEMADALEQLSWPSAVTIAMVADAASQDFREFLLDRRNSRRIPHRFDDAGYVQVRNDDAKDGYFKVGQKRCPIYARKTLTRRDQITAAQQLANRWNR